MARTTRLEKDGNWQPARVYIECCNQVAGAFEVPIERLFSKKRTFAVAHPRQAMMYVLRRRFNLSYPQIGMVCGGFDHTTVLHGCKAVEARIGQDPAFAAKIEQLISGQSLKHYTAHVIRFDTYRASLLSSKRKVRQFLKCPKTSREAEAAAEFAAFASLRNVKPKNALDPGDSDALKRRNGSRALSAAIAAAGGWPLEDRAC